MQIIKDLANLFLNFEEDLENKQETSEEFIVKFISSTIKVPELEKLEEHLDSFKNQVKDRVEIAVSLDSSQEKNLYSNKASFAEEFLEEIDLLNNITREDSEFAVIIRVNKAHNNDCLNIYCYSTFIAFLKSKSLKNLLHIFNEIISHREIKEFSFLDHEMKFQTHTINSHEGNSNKSAVERDSILNLRNEVCHFNQSSKFNLIPHDFHITSQIDEENYLCRLFDKLSILLSLVFIADVTELSDDDHLFYKINGYKTVSDKITLDQICINSSSTYIDIVNWIYSGGGLNDKIGLTRNIITINSNFDTLELGKDTFSSILSNYEIYLKTNVENYITVKNKISDHLVEASKKAGEIVGEFNTSFRNNFFAFFSFFFTVLIIRVVSVGDAKNIFTQEIAILSYAFLLTSIVYLGITIWHSFREKKRFDKVFKNLKERYGNLLHEKELYSIFDKNKEHKDDLKYITKNIIIQSIIWGVVILGLFYLVYSLSGKSIFYYISKLF